jgi:YVTN family beta-propeller protein
MAIWADELGPGDAATRGIIMAQAYAAPYIDTCYAGGSIFYVYTINGPADEVGGTCPAYGVWRQYVGTYDGLTMKLYLNGVLVANALSQGGNLDATGPVVIGQYSGGSYNFNGLLANAQMYSTALSAAQVQQLYQEGISGLPIANAGLAGWWPLNGNANDYSGNGNNGAATSVSYTLPSNYVRDSIMTVPVPTSLSPLPGVLSCTSNSKCSSSSLPNLYLGYMPIAFTPATVLGTVPTSTGPLAAAVTPNGAYVYVNNYYAASVSIINTTTSGVVKTISVGSNPWGVAFAPSGAYAYVTNAGSWTVSVINTATQTVTSSFSLQGIPAGIAFAPSGAYAYIANYTYGTVAVINTATSTVVNAIKVGSVPAGIAISPSGAYLYVANDGSGTVSVINTATDTVVNTITVGGSPQFIAISPNGAYVYVPNSVGYTVSVISTATNTVVNTITISGTGCGVAVSPNGAYVYVTNEYVAPLYTVGAKVSVISAATNTVVGIIAVGNVPYNVAFTPNGAYAYVMNNGDGTVTVINAATNAAVSAWRLLGLGIT